MNKLHVVYCDGRVYRQVPEDRKEDEKVILSYDADICRALIYTDPKVYIPTLPNRCQQYRVRVSLEEELSSHTVGYVRLHNPIDYAYTLVVAATSEVPAVLAQEYWLLGQRVYNLDEVKYVPKEHVPYYESLRIKLHNNYYLGETYVPT